jgi:chemotaxis protein methyltransferase WspC
MERGMTALETYVEDWARRRGLETSVLGTATLRAALRKRMTLTACDEPAYRLLLERSAAESAELLDELLVGETWFFRDVPAFNLLREAAVRFQATARTGPFRVLSLACASGEEPWSIAMILAESGLSGEHARIHALDLSARAVAKARRGIYGPRSFRGQALGERERFFVAVENGHRQIVPELHRGVSFAIGNITDGSLWAEPGVRYDAIFCRNVMIYLTVSTRKRIIEQARHLLRSDALLFLGHADSPATPPDGFTRHRAAGSFAWVRRDAVEGPVSGFAADTPPAAVRANRPPQRDAAPATPPARPATSAATNDSPIHSSPPPALQTARELADAGRYDAAERVCRSRLDRDPLDTEALTLLGIVALAAGRDDDAFLHLRRVIYLDPAHAEALAHLSLLHQKQGRGDLARHCDARSRRSSDPK